MQIWNQTQFRLLQNQSEFGKYNLFSVNMQCCKNLKQNTKQRRSQFTNKYFRNLVYQTKIRLHSSFWDRFGIKRNSIWFQINRKMVNPIWFRYDSTRFFRKYFPMHESKSIEKLDEKSERRRKRAALNFMLRALTN